MIQNNIKNKFLADKITNYPPVQLELLMFVKISGPLKKQ